MILKVYSSDRWPEIYHCWVFDLASDPKGEDGTYYNFYRGDIVSPAQVRAEPSDYVLSDLLDGDQEDDVVEVRAPAWLIRHLTPERARVAEGL